MIELNDSNVVKTMESGNHMLLFYAEWCPLVPPIVELLCKLEGENFRLATIHYDKSPIAAEYYNVPGVPTVIALQDGIGLRGWAGCTDAKVYQEFINKNWRKAT